MECFINNLQTSSKQLIYNIPLMNLSFSEQFYIFKKFILIHLIKRINLSIPQND